MEQHDKSVRLRQGLSAVFGEVRVGVAQVRPGEAVLSVRQPDGSRVQMTVKPGELVPIDGALRRVTEVHCSGRPTVLPGASEDAVIIDATPVALGSLKLHADSLAIPLGATGNAAGFDLEVVSLESDSAQLEVWPDEFAKPQTRPQLIKSFAVKGGARIPAGARQLAIVSVVPPNASTGLRGFVEVAPR